MTSSANSDNTSRILVVEDDPDVTLFVEQTLLRAGYAVTAANSVADARSQLNSGAYDLVLTDWRLPDGSGVVFAREAKATGAATLVITGYALSLPVAAFEGHQCLRKPLRVDELLSAIQHQIGPGQPANRSGKTGTLQGG